MNLEAINIEEIKKSINKTPKELLLSKIKSYIDKFTSTLETPSLQKELTELKEKNDYYRDAMKGIITIDQLRDEDINVLSEEDRSFWQDIRFIAKLNKESSDGGTLKIEREQRKRIASIYHDLTADLTQRIDYLEREIKANHDDITYGTIETYEKLMDKIKSDLALEKDDYEYLSIMLEDIENIDIDEEELFILYAYLGEYMLTDHSLVKVDNIPDDDEVSEVLEENQKLIEDNVLIELFKKYGYDYNLLKDEKKILLKQYGRIDKMTSIFEVFKKYIVDPDYLNNLAIILVYSSPDIVQNIFDNIDKDKTEQITGEYLFNNYMSSPNLFISGRKMDKERTSTGEFKVIDGEAGLYNNYQANRLFFINQGFNVTSALAKCISVFGTKNQTLVDTYAKYMSYEIPKHAIESKLSCLALRNVYEMMDLLIENRCEEHLKKHLSQSVQISRKYIKRIIMAKKLGLPYLNDNGTFPGYISNLHNEQLLTSAHISKDDLEKGISDFIEETEYFDDESLRKEKEVYDSQVEDVIYVRDKELEANKYIAYLDNNFLDQTLYNIYNIQGVLISRRKVLRVYGELIKKHDWENNKNLLMYAITYKSVLSREQLADIEKTVDYILKQTKEYK